MIQLIRQEQVVVFVRHATVVQAWRRQLVRSCHRHRVHSSWFSIRIDNTMTIRKSVSGFNIASYERNEIDWIFFYWIYRCPPSIECICCCFSAGTWQNKNFNSSKIQTFPTFFLDSLSYVFYFCPNVISVEIKLVDLCPVFVCCCMFLCSSQQSTEKKKLLEKSIFKRDFPPYSRAQPYFNQLVWTQELFRIFFASVERTLSWVNINGWEW